MKYTIMGFSQERVMELNESGCNIDITDLAILNWLEKISNSPKVVKEVIDGNAYFWVNYQSLLDDMPILGIKKRMLYARLQKMVDAGILSHQVKKQGGTFSMYAFSNVYDQLVFSENNKQFNANPQQNNGYGMQKSADGSAKKCREGVQKIAEQNNRLLDNPFEKEPFTKTNIICSSDDEPKKKDASKSEIESFFKSVWKLYPKKRGLGQVSQSAKKALCSYGYEQVERAINRYLGELRRTGKEEYMKNGSTFFNSGIVDYLDDNYEELPGGVKGGCAAGEKADSSKGIDFSKIGTTI